MENELYQLYDISHTENDPFYFDPSGLKKLAEFLPRLWNKAELIQPDSADQPAARGASS